MHMSLSAAYPISQATNLLSAACEISSAETTNKEAK